MNIWGITDTGLVRQDNQDFYATETIGAYDIAVVCDGMGGTNGGQVASSLAVETMLEHLRATFNDELDSQQMEQLVLQGITRCNEAIRQRAQSDPELSKMGTTMVCAVCRGGEAHIFNIGDSRCYLLGGDGIRQLTRDHSVVENMVESGKITVADAKHHPRRNYITRALGPDVVAQADSFRLALSSGEFLLLCTDGLVNTLSDQEILFEVVHCGDLDNCLQRLIETVYQNGAPDNVTVVLMQNL